MNVQNPRATLAGGSANSNYQARNTIHRDSAGSARHAEREEDELYALVAQAWELRGSPYLFDACRAILEWHDGRRMRQLQWEQELNARVLRLLRETPAALALPAADEERTARLSSRRGFVAKTVLSLADALICDVAPWRRLAEEADEHARAYSEGRLA